MQVTTEEIIYPCSDGQPMADSTIQYQLIVTIKEGCESLLKDDPNVFIAADLLCGIRLRVEQRFLKRPM